MIGSIRDGEFRGKTKQGVSMGVKKCSYGERADQIRQKYTDFQISHNYGILACDTYTLYRVRIPDRRGWIALQSRVSEA